MGGRENRAEKQLPQVVYWQENGNCVSQEFVLCQGHAAAEAVGGERGPSVVAKLVLHPKVG